MGASIIKDETFVTYLSTDVKAVTFDNGTACIEVDTKKVFIIHNGVWYEQ